MTAVVAGFLISALGGSRVQIGGPAGPLWPCSMRSRRNTAWQFADRDLDGRRVVVCDGCGTIGQPRALVPVSIIAGFTAGIAVIVGLSQVKDFLGLPIAKMPAEFFSQLSALGGAISHVNVYALVIGATSLLAIVLWPVSYQSIRSAGGASR